MVVEVIAKGGSVLAHHSAVRLKEIMGHFQRLMNGRGGMWLMLTEASTWLLFYIYIKRFKTPQ